jgi:DNA/RNA endonuclease YhcR with UshA esterase domain
VQQAINMKYIFSFILLCSFSLTRAQQSVKLEDIASHVGDSVTVTGKVYGIKYFESAKASPTLINIGAAFPNQLLTVVIYGEDRKRLELDPEKTFADADLSVTGKVELFKGKPQIVVTDKTQLSVLPAKKD